MKFNEVMRKAIGETKDLSMAYLEKGLDSFLDEGVLKEIPVVKTVYTALKLPISVANAYSMEKLMHFCCYMSEISDLERARYINKATNEDEHFGEKLLITLDKIDDLDKTQMLVKIFRGYGHKNGIDYHTFRRLCLALEKTYIEDLQYLKECVESPKDYFSGEKMINLSNSGLTAMTVVGGDLLNGDVFQILPLGQAFYKCVFTDQYEVTV